MDFFRRIYARTIQVLCSEKMPVWLTLVVAVSAAWGTYFLAPKINAAIEAQKSQSQYVYENLKLLNQDTAETLSVVGDIIETIADGEEMRLDQFSSLRRLVHRLQWRANEYETLFRSPTAVNIVKSYSESINHLQDSTTEAVREKNIQILLSSSERFAARSRDMVRFLSQRADWSSSFSLF